MLPDNFRVFSSVLVMFNDMENKFELTLFANSSIAKFSIRKIIPFYSTQEIAAWSNGGGDNSNTRSISYLESHLEDILLFLQYLVALCLYARFL